MVSKKLKKELKGWKKIDNLIEFKKFQYSQTFNLLYWSLGLFLIIFVLFLQSDKIINVLGVIWWSVLTSFFGIIFIWLIIQIGIANKKANRYILCLLKERDKKLKND